MFQQQMKMLRQQLDMECAIVAKIEDGQYQVVELDSDAPAFSVGDVFELNNTYCSAVCASQQTIVYNNVGIMEEMQLHPVYVAMQLNSYIGTPIHKNGKLWGTLNFSSTLARSEEFDYTAIKAVESLAEQYP